MEAIKSFNKGYYYFALYQVSREVGELFPEWKDKFFIYAQPIGDISTEYTSDVISLYKAYEIIDIILNHRQRCRSDSCQDLVKRLLKPFTPPAYGGGSEPINPHTAEIHMRGLSKSLAPFKSADRKKLFEVFF